MKEALPKLLADLRSDYNLVYKDCLIQRDEFLELTNKYLRKSGQEPLEVSSANGWQDVESSLTLACEALENIAAKDKELKGSTGRMKAAYRTLCNHANDAQGFLSLIPSDFMCSSVLSGGLKVVFKAMEQSSCQRTAIYIALEELPSILIDRASSIQVFRGDEELHRRMSALYISVLKFLGYILKWFTRNPLSKSVLVLSTKMLILTHS